MTPTAPDSATDEVALLSSKPVDADGVSAVLAGTIAWVVVGLVLMLFFRPALAEHGASWWLWVPPAGALMGLAGLPYVLRRRAAYRRHAAAHGESTNTHGGESLS
ncbi:MAG: DUF2530 domain-containing protein [Candidatus Nanopelagicales bacterium]